VIPLVLTFIYWITSFNLTTLVTWLEQVVGHWLLFIKLNR
jgi:NADH:ubiquinone oxidoreductase subunit 2 (subunit N)